MFVEIGPSDHRTGHCFLVSLDTLSIKLIHNENFRCSIDPHISEQLHHGQGLCLESQSTGKSKQTRQQGSQRHRRQGKIHTGNRERNSGAWCPGRL